MSKSNKPSYVGNARLVSDSPLSNKAMLAVGGVAIPFYEVKVTLKAGELATLEARIPADKLDLLALETQTRLTLVSETTIYNGSPALLKPNPGMPIRTGAGNLGLAIMMILIAAVIAVTLLMR